MDSDKLFKIQMFLNILLTNFKAAYTAGKSEYIFSITSSFFLFFHFFFITIDDFQQQCIREFQAHCLVHTFLFKFKIDLKKKKKKNPLLHSKVDFFLS